MKKPQIKKLDLIWSKKIKEIGNFKCLHCGKSGEFVKLEAAHIVGRGAHSTRWRTDNGLSLCFHCHQDYDQHRNHLEDWVRDWIGESKWSELQTAGRITGVKRTYEEVLSELEKE